MPSPRKFNPFTLFMGFLAVLLVYIVVGVTYNHEANAQQIERVVRATFVFVIVDPASGQERAFVCAPVPDNQEGVVTQ